MATKNKLFTTDIKKPQAPTVGKGEDVISIKEVSKLDPAIKLSLGKEAGFCITTDATLAKARAIVGLNISKTLFGGDLLTRLPGLPGNDCPFDPSSLLVSPGDIATDITDEALGELAYLEAKFNLSEQAQALCSQMEGACPTCPDWPDVLLALSPARLHAQFTTILGKLIAFGDPELFEMLLRCPEYMLKASFKQSNEMAKTLAGQGETNMFKTMVKTANPFHFTDLKETIRTLSGKSTQDEASKDDLDALLAEVGLLKGDLIASESYGMDAYGDTIFEVDNTVEAGAGGTANMESVAPAITQQMVAGVSVMIAARPIIETELDSIPGTWKDDTGYIHITDINLSDEVQAKIRASNKQVRRKRLRGMSPEVLDVRPNAGTPIDLNGCALV